MWVFGCPIVFQQHLVYALVTIEIANGARLAGLLCLGPELVGIMCIVGVQTVSSLFGMKGCNFVN